MVYFKVADQQEESLALLNIPTDRIGHGTFLHPEVGGSHDLVAAVEHHGIPLGRLGFSCTGIHG